MVEICKKKGPELENAARTKVSKTLLRCGSFDGKQIRGLSEKAVQQVKEKLTRLEDPASLSFKGMLEGMAGENVMKQAVEAAKLHGEMAEKGSDKAAKQIIQQKRNILLLSNEVARAVADYTSVSNVAGEAAESVKTELSKKLMHEAVIKTGPTITPIVMALMHEATSKQVDKAGTEAGITNPKIMEAGFSFMLAESWSLMNGAEIVKDVNENVLQAVTQKADGLTLKVATEACKAGHSMVDAVMKGKGIEGMEQIIARHVTAEAKRQIATFTDQLHTEAVSALAKAKQAHESNAKAMADNVWNPQKLEHDEEGAALGAEVEMLR